MKPILIPIACFAATCLFSFTAHAQSRSDDPFRISSGDIIEEGDPFGRNLSLVREDDPFGGDPFSGGAPGPDHPPLIIQVKYETFSLDLTAAASLMRKDLADGDLYDRILSLVKNGDAAQENLTVQRVLPGQKATNESISEYIYPTEWEQASASDTEDAHSKTENPADAKTATKTSTSNNGSAPALGTALETRNLGFTLEFETELHSDHNHVDVRISPEHVTLVSHDSWGQGASTIETPRIESQRMATGTTAVVGRPHLLGTVNRPPNSKVDSGKPGQIWFAFFTVSLVK